MFFGSGGKGPKKAIKFKIQLKGSITPVYSIIYKASIVIMKILFTKVVVVGANGFIISFSIYRSIIRRKKITY